MPGVSMSVAVRSACDGQVTTSWSTSSGRSPPRSTSIASSSRVNRSWRGCAAARMGHHLVGVPVAVPGDDAGALAGVGRGEPLPDQRVEQRRLARLHPAGDGHPQRLVEPVAHGDQPGVVRRCRGRRRSPGSSTPRVRSIRLMPSPPSPPAARCRELAQPGQLRLEVAQPLVPFGLGPLDRLGRGGERLRVGPAQLLGQRRVVVAQLRWMRRSVSRESLPITKLTSSQ